MSKNKALVTTKGFNTDLLIGRFLCYLDDRSDVKQAIKTMLKEQDFTFYDLVSNRLKQMMCELSRKGYTFLAVRYAKLDNKMYIALLKNSCVLNKKALKEEVQNEKN